MEYYMNSKPVNETMMICHKLGLDILGNMRNNVNTYNAIYRLIFFNDNSAAINNSLANVTVNSILNELYLENTT